LVVAAISAFPEVAISPASLWLETEEVSGIEVWCLPAGSGHGFRGIDLTITTYLYNIWTGTNIAKEGELKQLEKM